LADLDNDRSSGPAVLLAKSVRIDDRIAAFLLDEDRIDSRLTRLVEVVRPGAPPKGPGLPPDMERRLLRLTARYARSSFVCSLWGQDWTGKREVAGAICSALGAPMLAADLKSVSGDETTADTLVPLLFREGILYDGAVYLDDADGLLAEGNQTKQFHDRVVLELRSYPGWVVLSSDKSWQPGGTLENKPFVSIELPSPSYAERRYAWEDNVKGEAKFGSDINLGDLAGKFRFGSDQIRQAVAVAENIARWRDPETPEISGEDLYAACRVMSRKTLISLARQIQPSYCWEDIVLPRDKMEQLREICSYVQHYHTVYSDWGFSRKVSSGKGLNALFYGVSGTGKTMAADVIANSLKIDLYKIDLSAIVSKYIGETEKNLDQIFREGQTSNAILFFDEADALFGKRSEVRDSHDRYANIEVAYLLQKMDEYDGVVILATNLRKNMDEAFARRMHFAVEFPTPEEDDRLRIWKHMFPEEAPMGKDVDLPFMARQFKLTGGNIKNIAINAAFLAAQEGPELTMAHLVHATKREFQKIGKLCTQADFAGYFELVKG
jgi:AAA+ superfamily predicted ATPase